MLSSAEHESTLERIGLTEKWNRLQDSINVFLTSADPPLNPSKKSNLYAQMYSEIQKKMCADISKSWYESELRIMHRQVFLNDSNEFLGKKDLCAQLSKEFMKKAGWWNWTYNVVGIQRLADSIGVSPDIFVEAHRVLQDAIEKHQNPVVEVNKILTKSVSSNILASTLVAFLLLSNATPVAAAASHDICHIGQSCVSNNLITNLRTLGPSSQYPFPRWFVETNTVPSHNVDPIWIENARREIFTTQVPTKHPLALFFIGGPGTGKGTMMKTVLKKLQMNLGDIVVLDSDAIMATLPGYQHELNMGSIGSYPVTEEHAAENWHEQAKAINNILQKEAIAQSYNVLIDGTGKDADKMIRKINEMRTKGYKIVIAKPSLPLEIASERVKQRANEGGRLVPDDYVSYIYHTVEQNVKKIQNVADEFYIVDTAAKVPTIEKV